MGVQNERIKNKEKLKILLKHRCDMFTTDSEVSLFI